MLYCVSPQCLNPQNPDDTVYCRSCGSEVLLKKRYRAIKPLGRGGFGRTFLATDEDIPSKPHCVIKQLYVQIQDPLILKKAIQLFHQEADRLEELGQHPQIPTLLAHFEQKQQLYLVQEFIEGRTLEQELSHQGAFNEAQIWALLRDLLPVLNFVHDRSVIHRDIKPANIIAQYPNKEGSDRTFVLIDFGVAKLFTDTALLRTGTTVGSAEYMAPEQSRGKALPASDLYSLGVTCIHLLTHVSPFDLFDIHQNQWVWRNYLPQGRQVSDRLGRILDKLLQSAVNERYQSVTQVLQDIEPVKVALPKPASPTVLPTTPSILPNFLSNLLRQYTAHPEGDSLISAVGINYTKLQHFLAAGQWQQADEETWGVLSEALGKKPGTYLHISDIDRIYCEDLRTIDNLWVKYSQSRFGFSIQKQIYEAVDKEYPQFCDRVGWPIHNVSALYSVLNFSDRAPLGHLPSRQWIGGYEWWRHMERLAARVQLCGIGL